LIRDLGGGNGGRQKDQINSEDSTNEDETKRERKRRGAGQADLSKRNRLTRPFSAEEDRYQRGLKSGGPKNSKRAGIVLKGKHEKKPTQ